LIDGAKSRKTSEAASYLKAANDLDLEEKKGK